LGSDVVPATVRRFVEGHFDTVTAVEVLLLLRRESPRAFSSDAVARQLRIDPDQTEGILSELDQHGLVRRQGASFEYGPRSEEAAGAVETLASVYSKYRHRIIGIIFTKRRLSDSNRPVERGRSMKKVTGRG
jgi:hypothetical protein